MAEREDVKPTSCFFHEKDLRQIQSQGTTLEKILSDIDFFKKGFPFVRLDRPCTVGDGITVLQSEDLDRLDRLGAISSQAARSGRVTKFVPASGAASRMFQFLLSVKDQFDELSEQSISAKAKEGDNDCQAFGQFIADLKHFAFYEDLRSVMAEDGLQIESEIAQGRYRDLVEYLLESHGLNYANLPKGLIKFHRYSDHARTPVEEHLVEAAAYVQNKDQIAQMHFTVSPEHQERISGYIEQIRHRYEQSGCQYIVTFSIQKPSTDTIAVDRNNEPFRDETTGELVFRPGGHGALLENLNDLQGDIVFIKNIDNVVPDRLKAETYCYKKALCGYLIQLQEEIFSYLQKLSQKDVHQQLLNAAFEFARHKLSIIPPYDVENGMRDEKLDFLKRKLNRPLRVCGMVKNTGEPGGGPFWVKHAGGAMSLQIVESSQVNRQDPGQQAIWQAATHFNPVDLVCGIRDYLGKPFNLLGFSNPDTGFIASKSKDGRELRALELPGLWNGAMANWNTVFVEVPMITFNPVKTLLDLLRPEHQDG